MKRRILALFCAALLAALPVISVSAASGDVDADGKVTAADARFVLRAAVGLENVRPGSELFTDADVDGDGKLTAGDARALLRAAVGLEALSADAALLRAYLRSILIPFKGLSAEFRYNLRDLGLSEVKTEEGVPAAAAGLVSAVIDDLNADGKPELLTVSMEKADSCWNVTVDAYGVRNGAVAKLAKVYESDKFDNCGEILRVFLTKKDGRTYIGVTDHGCFISTASNQSAWNDVLALDETGKVYTVHHFGSSMGTGGRAAYTLDEETVVGTWDDIDAKAASLLQNAAAAFRAVGYPDFDPLAKADFPRGCVKLYEGGGDAEDYSIYQIDHSGFLKAN